MKLFPLFCPIVSALYRNELRHLPEKLRQERIHQTVLYTFQTIQQQVIRAASDNHTDFRFPLFCLEPNTAQEEYESKGQTLYQPNGSKYRLSQQEEWYLVYRPIYPKPRCESKYGYELYRKGSQYLFPVQKIEDHPLVYIQRFFELFNQAFPDIWLVVSQERPSKGIFENECCPLYIISW